MCSSFPDLRRTSALHDQGLFDTIVLNGTLSQNGMASFNDRIGNEETVALRAYIISLAEEALAQE